MRRIIPVVCAVLMVFVIMSYTDNTDIDNSDIVIEENTIESESVPEPIIIPETTPIDEVVIEEPVQEIEPIEPVQEIEPIEPVQEIEPIEEPTWWTDYDLDLLAAAIHYEAGSSYCVDEHQQLVAQVVVNRMNDPRYPDTIYDVITDTKFGIQYSSSHMVTANAGNRDIISQRCYDNALVVLNGEIECPTDVIYQAEFKQGTGIYKVFETPYSTTYFCYG